MVWIMYAVLAVALLAIALVVVMLVKQLGRRRSAGVGSYDVFEISGNQLVVLAGIPVTYEIDVIERITFSAMKAPRSIATYNGVMRVVKAGGKKSRPFLFNSSAYTKKTVLASSKQDIELTIRYLMDELRRHHIPCSRTA